MTTRPYYNDSYTRQFEATVIETATYANEPFVVLDATYFYPTSGGQPHDVGTLGPARVVDVRIREGDNAILHILDIPLQAGTISATIDAERRFDHMQQHTGQHILSQSFIRAANAATIGFHLGTETVSIDVDKPALSDAEIADAAHMANELIASNVEVRAWFPLPAELEMLKLRKMPDVQGPLRVVAIGDFDYSACGGTHVARSGEIGLLSVLRTERMKRGTRIEFLAGHRARTDYARKHATIRELSSALTCAPEHIVDSVAKLTASVTEARRALAVFRERDLDDEATRLVATGTVQGALTVVRAAWSDRPIDEVKGLALRLTGVPDIIAALGTTGARTQLVFARSENVTTNLKPAFDAALASLGGGKGGGGRVIMGSAAPADLSLLQAALRTEIGPG